MTRTTYYKRIPYILQLIKKGQLTSPSDLAIQFECTEKTIRNMINDLRDLGHQIKYCRKNRKYIVI